MSIHTEISDRIQKYNPKGQLGHTARLFLSLYSVNHKSTEEHVSRVALRAEHTATVLGKDAKASFFAGLLHDVGKIMLPAELFDGHNISADEYAQVKTHARAGFLALRSHHMFTALCAGLHHNLYQAGYGVTIEDFPSNWSLASIKKVLEVSTIVSICDFIDAYTHRTTTIKDGSDSQTTDMREMLYQKYPNDRNIIEAALSKGDNQC